jgi:P27 family predicted phage terminase small subunit
LSFIAVSFHPDPSMATRGRKPTPTALKLLKGTRRDRLPSSEPRPRPARPKCPGHLDHTARAEWRRLLPILERMRVLTEADGAALAIYCAAFSRCRLAEREIGNYGLLVLQENGILKRNPAEVIVAECEATMARVLVEFGLTPSARTRVKVAEADGPRDALTEFLQRRRGGA